MLMICVSAVLFVFADNNKTGWLAVAKTISWTLSAILIWFMLIGPLFTKAIQKVLQKKESRYSDEVLKTLSFLPVLRRLTALAWQQSRGYKGFSRWYHFLQCLFTQHLPIQNLQQQQYLPITRYEYFYFISTRTQRKNYRFIEVVQPAG
ncbi:MAG: hypothetical protein IPL50_05250 [Chitinophagaceae bacterium]|nr:hypothetical protein [Chitinophagaceae bacterium]